MSAAIGHGPSAFWYLTRSTGVVAYVLLSAAVVLGIVTTVGPGSRRWPRFATQGLHRTVSLLCVIFVSLHVVTTVADGYVPIGIVDALVPFHTPYRPLWIGLGAMSFDFLLAVAITSLLRRHLGLAAWRGVHWLAYACWPVASVARARLGDRLAASPSSSWSTSSRPPRCSRQSRGDCGPQWTGRSSPAPVSAQERLACWPSWWRSHSPARSVRDGRPAVDVGGRSCCPVVGPWVDEQLDRSAGRQSE